MLIPQRLAALQDRHHPLLGLRVLHQLGVFLKLQIKQILLGDPLWAGQVAAAQHRAQRLRELLIVGTDITARAHAVQRRRNRGLAAPTNKPEALRALVRYWNTLPK